MIQLRNVSKTFTSKSGVVEALRNVNVTIEDGDIFGFIGSSGAGKSALIRLVNGLELPTHGEVLVNGKDIVKLSKQALNQQRKKIGMVFQQFHLLNSKTVFDNVAIPLVLNHVSKSEIEQRVTELLAFVELSDKTMAYPDQLSGGQKQRVGIARALATNPSILLCDEATSALDPKTTNSILQLLKKVNEEFGVTILIITHEMNVIKDICNRVAVLSLGNIVEEGSVLSMFSQPKHEVTREFVRTIQDDTIPEYVYEQIKQHRDHVYVCIRVQGNEDNGNLLYTLNRKYDVMTHILFSNVSELKGTSMGSMVLELRGMKEAQDKALAHLRTTKTQWERLVV